MPACKLTSHPGITQVPRTHVTYVHFLFDRHQVVTVDGVASESFFPGDQGLRTLGAETREELFALFPILRESPRAYGSTCRPVALNVPIP